MKKVVKKSKSSDTKNPKDARRASLNILEAIERNENELPKMEASMKRKLKSDVNPVSSTKASKIKKLKVEKELPAENPKPKKLKRLKSEKAASEEEKNPKKVKLEEKTTQVPGKKSTKDTKINEVCETDDFDVNQVGNLELSKKHVTKCVKAVLQLANNQKGEKKSLLPDDSNPIIIQVNSIKVPQTPRRNLRLFLPHAMVGPTDEVALFVPDISKGLRQDYEKSVEHWEAILREKNVTAIKEVIPLNRVKTEFRQFEMITKLGRLFDFFLVDGRIAGHLTHILGKAFRKVARTPTPVKMDRTNLKEELDNALKKSSMEIHHFGNTHSAYVASVTMKENQIIENIMAAVEGIKGGYPGGMDNIKSILIKTRTSLAIPIYYSFRNKNQVSVPKVEPKRPKAFKILSGELSTLENDATVTVTPGGRVKLEQTEEVTQIKPDKLNVEKKKKKKQRHTAKS